ncbi:MAG: twin-arginine translocase subunit TatC, partial [Chloroflexi bacterium]|nr:twin-arginine translocase subunit TatC [Chloroflexota bacterium]
MADVDAVPDAGVPALMTPAPEGPPAAAPEPPPAAAAAEMSLVDHLGELRNRLIKVIIAVAVAAVIGFIFSGEIV